MPSAVKQATAIALLASSLAPVNLGAQMILTANAAKERPVADAVPLTAKERLGKKWKDEQRIDNCKVPVEMRGSKPRPDGCVHVPSG